LSNDARGSMGSPKPARSVIVWLAVVYAMVFAMVLIGGITRLTGSGLSMVEWHPLMGALPPLDEASWHEVFAKYQQSPQYQQVNGWMELAHFKRIFFWEYLHRLFGRLIGIVFVVPWVVLLLRKRLTGKLAVKTGVAFVLGGLQGLLGWYMVRSGLVDRPEVSHFRLAAHLALALLVACWVLWLLFDTFEQSEQSMPRRTTMAAWAMVGVVAVQAVYGAFMAGTRAGYIYPSFPDINGRWLPPQAFAYEPFYRNITESVYGIHFFHRTFGWLTAFVIIAFCVHAWRKATSWQSRLATRALIPMVVLQIALGGITVVWRVPMWSAAMHQAGGFLLLSLALLAAHSFRTSWGHASRVSERVCSKHPSNGG
jgi:cytochrome c oxidase assembly protein subunit 15